jgi:GntR family transcriptional regulator
MIVGSHNSRYSLVREELLSIIRELASAGRDEVNKLPTEEELARRLGVSVATVREALRMLEREGIVSKRHGAGNFYHRSALDLNMRIDTILHFSELLRDGGFEVSERCENVSFRPADDEEERCFGISGEYLAYSWLYLADGKVAIYTTNLVPAELLSAKERREIEVQSNVMEFIWRYTGERITNANVSIEPRLASERELWAFEAEGPLSLIEWNQTFYNHRDKPVAYVRVAFNPLIVKMHLLQKWS